MANRGERIRRHERHGKRKTEATEAGTCFCL